MSKYKVIMLIVVIILICNTMLYSVSRLSFADDNENTTRYWTTPSWVQRWVGGFGTIYRITYSNDYNKIYVAGSTVVFVIDAETYEITHFLTGSDRAIFGLDVSKIDNKVVTGDGTGNVIIWKNYEQDKILSISTRAVLSVSWSPDNKRIAAGTDDGKFHILDVDTNTELISIKAHTDGITGIDYSPDGRYIVTCASAYPTAWPDTSYDDTIKLWNASTGELIYTFRGHTDGVTSVMFSQNGEKILSSSKDGTIKIWNVNTHTNRTFNSGYKVNSAVFTYDETKIIAGTDNDTVEVWDILKKEKIDEFIDETPILAVAVSKDNTIVSGSRYGVLNIWRLNRNTPLKTLSGHNRYVLSVDASPDGSKVVSGSADTTIRVWDAETGDCIKILEGHTDWVNVVKWSPDGRYIASGGDFADQTIKIWDVVQGYQNVLTLHRSLTDTGRGGISDIAWSPDGKKLAAVAGSSRGGAPTDLSIWIWNIPSGTLDKKINNIQQPYSIDWSSDGKYLLVGNSARDGVVKVWDAETGELLAQKLAHDFDVYSVAWSHDGNSFTSGSWRSLKVWRWDATDKEITFQQNMDQGYLIWSTDWRDDDTMFLGTAKETAIWEPETGKCITMFKGHDGNRYPYVCGGAWVDKKRIVTGGGDLTVRLWYPAIGISVNTSTRLRAGEQTYINLHFSYLGQPVAYADVEISTDIGTVSKTTGKSDANGDFTTIFYAPNTEKNITCDVKVFVSKPDSDYGNSKTIIPISVYPKVLLLNVSDEYTIRSGENANITVHVEDYVGNVSDVELHFSVDMGEVIPNSGNTNRDGILKVVYTAPETDKTLVVVLHVTATKKDYKSVEKSINIYIQPANEYKEIEEGGWYLVPYMQSGWILIIFFVIAFVMRILHSKHTNKS